jgi:hypothetical protein
MSIALYRLSPFHPLANVPGPTLAKISRFYAAYHVWTGRQHLVSYELFEQYQSNVVRTGPNHVIICDEAAISTMLGGRDRWQKHDRTYHALFITPGFLLTDTRV